MACQYYRHAIDRVERRLSKPTNEGRNDADTQGTAGTQPTTNEVKTESHICLSYTQGLCESIKKSAVSMTYRPLR